MSRGRTRSATARFTSCGLAALLFVGFPANALVEAASPVAPAVSSGILSVESDPPGAAVFVDGEALGTTPIAVRTLPAGDHRVRVAMEGYLDNSRVVRVNGGQAESVKIKLTRNERSAASMQVDPQPATKSTEKKGSGKKWALIGLGAAAVGAAVYVVATKNSPPVAGTVGVSPTGTGMAGITSYSFTAQGASDPDKDPLTINWNFGDGGSGSGATTTHVFASAGSFSVSYTVSDGKATVTAPTTTVTVGRSMAGVWTGGLEPGFNDPYSINLTQSGTSLGGSMSFGSGGTVTGLTGTVSGTTYPVTVNFTQRYSFSGVGVTDQFSGTTDSTGSTMTGTMTVTLTGAFFTATGSSTATGANTLRR